MQRVKKASFRNAGCYNKTMEESIFAKIIKGEIPAHKIYEDDRTFAFLDIHPVQPGHTLVISKAQVDLVWDLSDEDYLAVMATCKKVARRLKDALGVTRIGSQIIGIDVPHAHVHLIPFNTVEEFRASGASEPDHEVLAKMAKRLAF